MQYTLDLGSPLEQVRTVLLRIYGHVPPPVERLEPVPQIVRSILGCRTRDEVSWTVFNNLRKWCGDEWERLLDLTPEKLVELIRPVEHVERKAVWLQESIREIKARYGRLNLDFLSEWPAEQAFNHLLKTKPKLIGVGPKVTAAALNFSTLRLRVFVVDTHVWRVSQRLGLIGPKVSADRAHSVLLAQMPAAWNADDLYELHCLLKALGQDFCTAKRPNCWDCPLNDSCKRVGLQTLSVWGKREDLHA